MSALGVAPAPTRRVGGGTTPRRNDRRDRDYRGRRDDHREGTRLTWGVRLEVGLLSAAVLLALVLPSRLVVPGLGAEGRPATVFGIALFMLWLARSVRSIRRPTPSRALRTLLVLLWVSILWSYAAGFDRGLTAAESSAADRSILVWLGVTGLLLGIAEGVRSQAVLDRVLKAAVVGGAFMSVVGIGQAFGFNLVSYMRIPGLVFNSPVIGVSARGDGGLARVAGTAAHYIEFGTVAALLFPLALHYWRHSESVRGRVVNRWSICAGLLLSAVPFSLSRTCFLVLAIATAVYSLSWSRRYWLNALVLGAAAAAIYQQVRPGLAGTVRALFAAGEKDPSIEGRLQDYPKVLAYISEHPLVGRGPGTFLPEQYFFLDNQVLMTLLTMGVVGMVVLVALIGTAAVLLGRVMRRRVAPDHRSLSLALLGIIAGGVAASLTFDSLSFNTFATVFWMGIGAAFAMFRITGERIVGRRIVIGRPRSLVDSGVVAAGSRRNTAVAAKSLVLPAVGHAQNHVNGEINGLVNGHVNGHAALDATPEPGDDQDGVPSVVPAQGGRPLTQPVVDHPGVDHPGVDHPGVTQAGHPHPGVTQPVVTRTLLVPGLTVVPPVVSGWLAPLSRDGSLRSSVARGARASSYAQIFKLVLQITSTIVLFRILGAEAFGIVGMALAVTALADLLREAGLASAVITRPIVTQAQVSALFWINVGIGLALAVIVAAMGWPLAWFYGEPDVQWVTLGLSAVYVFSGLGVQHQALLMRTMNFSSVAVRDAIAQGIGVASAIGLALAGAGLWSLVALYVVAAAVRTLTAWTLCSWRPSAPRFDVPGLRSLLFFGRNVSTFSLLNYAARNADKVLLGRFVGAEALGLYGRAYSLVLVPLQQITQPLGPPTMAALSRLREDPERFRAAYLRVLSTTSLLGLPLVGLMAVLADPAVGVVLGPEGEPATRIFQFLALAAAAQVISATAGWLYLASDRTGAMVRWALWTRPLIVVAFVVGLPWGATGVAIAYAASTFLLLPPGMANAARGTAVHALDWVKAAAWPAVAAAVGAAAALGGKAAGASLDDWAGSNADIVVLLSGGAAGTAAILLTLALVPPLRRQLVDIRRSLGGPAAADVRPPAAGLVT